MHEIPKSTKSLSIQSHRPIDPRPNLNGLLGLVVAMMLWSTGCNLVPDIRTKPQYHNPFPQLSKVAILPFRNQSQDPTLSGARVSMAYYNELQSVPGFEVVPFGAVESQLAYYESKVISRPMMTGEDFQKFAQYLGVDAVLQGAITDFDSFYPPRMTLKVNWYAANPGLHPIPVGYGLPWGTKAEKKIPSWVKLEAERALAKEQIETQTPYPNPQFEESDEEAPTPQFQKSVPISPEPKPAEGSGKSDGSTPNRLEVKESIEDKEANDPIAMTPRENALRSNERLPGLRGAKVVGSGAVELSTHRERVGTEELENNEEPSRLPAKLTSLESQPLFPMDPEGNRIAPSEPSDILTPETIQNPIDASATTTSFPSEWPDPQGFIPKGPRATRPEFRPQSEPIVSHMKAYNGNDEDFTRELKEYYYFRDDARAGGWQTYLQRSEDFIRFCCHRHIIETLESRGGQLESRLNLRWPINRYER